MRRDKTNIFFIIFAIFWTIPIIAIAPQLVGIIIKNGVAIIIPLFIMFAVPICLWGVVIAKMIRRKRANKIGKEGEVYSASFVDFRTNTRVNGVCKYRIHYVWKDHLSNVHEGKTLDVYNLDEIYLFKAATTFRIKAIDDESVVIDEPSTLVFNPAAKEEPKEVLISCEYCGSVYSKDERKCPSCGASKK